MKENASFASVWRHASVIHGFEGPKNRLISAVPGPYFTARIVLIAPRVSGSSRNGHAIEYGFSTLQLNAHLRAKHDEECNRLREASQPVTSCCHSCLRCDWQRDRMVMTIAKTILIWSASISCFFNSILIPTNIR
jgi:hypothetical protein